MRLPELHRRLLSNALGSGPAYRLVLAGGYAIQAHELVSRYRQDLDLATDAAQSMHEITGAVSAGLENRGWVIHVVEVAPQMARLLATDAVTGEACELDIMKEIFHRPPAQTDAGTTPLA